MKQIVAGIVAHVDAGKTTLSEALLYRTGEIRKLGRVDHGDAFLDTNSLEKARGITIFAHQALVEHGDLRLTLLDTPGHVDFAAETERVLRVLDYAILVVSGTDGVQGHTETLWRLLARYGVPTFIFVNKCDAAGFDREAILAQLRKRLSDAIYPLPAMEQSTEGSAVPLDAFAEDIATLDEEAMNDYLEHGALSVGRLRAMIAVRELFPVYFGSALKLEGVEEFLDGLETFTRERGCASPVVRSKPWRSSLHPRALRRHQHRRRYRGMMARYGPRKSIRCASTMAPNSRRSPRCLPDRCVR